MVVVAGNNANQLDEQLLNKLSGGDPITVQTLCKTHGREQPVHFALMMLMNEMFSPAGNAATDTRRCSAGPRGSSTRCVSRRWTTLSSSRTTRAAPSRARS